MNSVVVYRENALTEQEFSKLETLAAEKLNIKPKFVRVVLSERDEYGDLVERADFVESGYEVFPRGEVSEKLIESLQRKCRKQHIALHLTKLELHKRYGRTQEAWKMILEDLCNDLAQVSEYAIIKTCEKYRHDTSSPFFPDTAKLIKDAKELDWSLRNISFSSHYSGKEQHMDVEGSAGTCDKSARSKRRVKRIVGLMFKKREQMTVWEQRYMDAMGRKSKG